MSERFPGGFITNNPTAPTTTSAPGIWTLDQATQYIKAGTWPYGGPFNYIEDVFSTYLYTGNGSSQTITNGIDLAGKGGLWWAKQRNSTGFNWLVDTSRGADVILRSNTTDAALNVGLGASFLSNGYSFGPTSNSNYNASGSNYVSWTFRKQPKFFDVVTYTGNGGSQTISHNLGSTPGCIIIKKLDSTSFNAGWAVYHRSLTNPDNYYLVLNTTAAQTNYGAPFISSVSSTSFTVDGASGFLGLNGSSYVAYLFAHNAGGFGSSNTDNVISCGSFTQSGGTATVNLGYEPQWILLKANSAGEPWTIVDNMRGMAVSGNQARLFPNDSSAEDNNISILTPTATGFVTNANLGGSLTYIYIAIRRGPMQTPTSGTSVYNAISRVGTGTAASITGVGFPPDLFISTDRYAGYTGWISWYDKLRGIAPQIHSDSPNAEITLNPITSYDMNGITVPANNYFVGSGDPYIFWFFRRAPGFFDEVCYTGTGTNTTQAHNLGVVPELMIVKTRDAARNWIVYSAALGTNNGLYLNVSNAVTSGFNVFWNSAAPTASVINLGTGFGTNGSGESHVAYLFASCPGVSKVGSYTGNGSTQTINCGFTGGARFVLIKRTDASGDWYVYDTTRGMTTLTDPYLLMNGTGGEVATLGSVTTVSTGFALNASILAAINTNGASYIFLAIA